MKNQVTKVQVSVNNKEVVLEKKEMLTLLDVLIEAGYNRDVIMPRESKFVQIEYNGEPTKVHFGLESATKVFLNGERAGLLSLVNNGDRIAVEEFSVDKETSIQLSKLEEYNENIIFDVDGDAISVLRLVEVNGRLNFGDVSVKSGDVVKAYDYYTASQLRDCLGLEEDIVLMANDKELKGDDAIYETTIVDTYIRTAQAPFINKRETSSFKLFIGDDFTFNAKEEEKIANEVVDEVQEIKVMINGETVNLNNKKSYAVIDALDAANIDAMQAVGKTIIITVNDMKASFATQINNDDVVEFSYN